MKQIPDRRAARVVDEALRSENPGELTDFDLVIAGENREDDLNECVISAAEGVGISLDATLGLRLSSSVVSQRTTLDCIVAGVSLRRFTGSAWFADLSEGQTGLLCHSAGFWLGKVELGKRLAPPSTGYAPLGQKPSTILSTVLSAAPYESGLVRIEEIPAPLFTRDVFSGFKHSDFLADVVQSLNAEDEILLTDLSSGGVRARKRRKLPADSAVWEFVVGRDLDAQDFSAERQEDPYFDVAVYRSESDGTQTELARVAVPGSKAPPGATLQLESSDTGSLAYENALQQAHDAAYALWRGSWTVSARIPWLHPLLERGDTVAFVETDGPMERRFHVLLSGVRDFYPVLAQELLGVPGEAVIVSETPVSLPTLAPMLVGTSLLKPLFGFDYLTRLYFARSLTWISFDPARGFVLRPDLAALDGISVTYGAHYGIAIAELGWIPPAPRPTGVTWDDTRTFEELGNYTFEQIS